MQLLDLVAEEGGDYEYLDAGDGERLERFGDVVLNRPSPQALWRKEHPTDWQSPAGVYVRSSSGGGEWQFQRELPASWPVKYGPCTFQVKPTGFGHVGLFPEHSCHWPWVAAQIQCAPAPCQVLHLFAYTGAMTLMAARAGAQVCHVDAVQDINRWARQNAEASGLANAPIRWITDDATRFVARETRRKRQYHGIILDPPSYGKGPEGEKWILEEHLLDLLGMLQALMTTVPRFVLFTCHTPGFSTPLMSNLLLDWMTKWGGKIETGNMVLRNRRCTRVLPAGVFARWSVE